MKKKLISVTDEQLLWMKETAGAQGISVSELFRRMIDRMQLEDLLSQLAKTVKQAEDQLARMVEITELQPHTDNPGRHAALEITRPVASGEENYPTSQSADSDSTIFTSVIQV